MYVWCICKRCLSYLEYHRTVASHSLLLCLFFMGGKNNMLTGHICMELAGSAVRSCNYPSVSSCYSNFFLITVNSTYNMFMHTNIISQRIEKKYEMCEQKQVPTHTYKYKQIEILQCLIAFAYSYYKKNNTRRVPIILLCM